MMNNAHKTSLFSKYAFRNDHGFTMIEILITILVMSIGLLGVAGIQAKGMQNTLLTYQHTIATTQAQDIADRMRANLGGVRSGRYNAITGIPTSPPDCTSIASTCTESEIAEFDRSEWNAANATLLPSGAGVVNCTDLDAATSALEIGSSCLIIVRWDRSRNGATGTGCDPTNVDDMACVQLALIP